MSLGRRLEGKIVIITGGASGIGAEAVKIFTEHGARVVIADVQDELGQNAAVSIGRDKVGYYHCDVRDETEVENAVKFTVKKHGRSDVLFNNAGVLENQQQEEINSILDLDLNEFDRVMAVNLRGAASFIKHAARAMVERGTRGSIVCTTSIAAEIVGTAPHGYTASKHGLLGLIKSAAGELGKHGIRVNGVAPSGIATPMVCDGYKMEASKLEENFSLSANLKGIMLKLDTWRKLRCFSPLMNLLTLVATISSSTAVTPLLSLKALNQLGQTMTKPEFMIRIWAFLLGFYFGSLNLK